MANDLFDIDIKRGDPWVLDMVFFDDEAETIPQDVSSYSFKLMAVDSKGTVVLTLTNADFVQINTNNRRITKDSTVTAGYPKAGYYPYEIQRQTSPADSETIMEGFIKIKNQITT